MGFFQALFRRMFGAPTAAPRSVYVDGVPGAPVVLDLTNGSSTLTIDTSAADTYRVTLTQGVTVVCENGVDGKGTVILLTQGSGGSKTITLDSDMLLPSSATEPLAWSTAAGKTDILAVRYDSAMGKWLVVSVVPGY